MTKAERYVADYLITLAGGYWMATPEQIATVAAQFDMEPWKVEAFYFDVCEAADAENTWE